MYCEVVSNYQKPLIEAQKAKIDYDLCMNEFNCVREKQNGRIIILFIKFTLKLGLATFTYKIINISDTD